MELRNVLNPAYLYRPSQIVRRLSYKPSSEAVLKLPWNCSITACSADNIGRAIAAQGLYDLPVTEALIRLSEPGETALDVGANIGYMSLVLALSVGAGGRVIGFEPNPDVMLLLRRNVSDWSSLPIARIEIKPIALSDRNGEARLGFRADYAENSGIASLEIENGGIPVEVFRLDSLDIAHAGVVKVDVEGHETAVFRGARDLLARKAIRDIVFEEYEPYPARSHNVLLEHGYRIFRLKGTAWRPLLSPAEMETNRQANVPINYIASAEPSRVEKRFRHRGWHALSGRLGLNK